jgi:hypothetical protein
MNRRIKMFKKLRDYLGQLVEDWNMRQCKKKIRKAIEKGTFDSIFLGANPNPVGGIKSNPLDCDVYDYSHSWRTSMGMRRLLGKFGKSKKIRVDLPALFKYASKLQYNKLHSRPILEGTKKKPKTEEERTKEMKAMFPVSKNIAGIPNETCSTDRIDPDVFIKVLLRGMSDTQKKDLLNRAVKEDSQSFMTRLNEKVIEPKPKNIKKSNSKKKRKTTRKPRTHE